MNFITSNQTIYTRHIYIHTYIHIPGDSAIPASIKNSGCTLTARWTFNYIIPSVVKALLQFIQHPKSICECYNITEIKSYFHLQKQMCNTVPIVLHIYMTECQQELFHMSAPKYGNWTHFWDVIFMQWLTFYKEDRRNYCSHHIRLSSDNLLCSHYHQYFFIQCISFY